jgi:uncharacterized lipoprotein YmbA
MKTLLLTILLLAGCASRPEKAYYPADMQNFVSNCSQAKIQMDFLSQKINEYNEYHQNNTPTLEDRRYYGKLKNNLWSLRSTCSQKFL